MTIKTINTIFYIICSALLFAAAVFFGFGAYATSTPLLVVAGCSLLASFAGLFIWNSKRARPW